LNPSPSKSPFLELPGELRSHIYRYVLHSDDRILKIRDIQSEPPNLLLVSKQIRAEVCFVYYMENQFRGLATASSGNSSHYTSHFGHLAA
jgi:hypothetical protein